MSVRASGVTDETTYAPVPTGVALANVAGSDTPDQMCLGRMNVLPAMKNRSENSGRLKDSVTVCGSEVATEVSGRLNWLSALFVIARKSGSAHPGRSRGHGRARRPRLHRRLP